MPAASDWSNWAGNQRARAARVVAPGSAVRVAAAEGLTVKPVGAGHSFTAAAATDGVRLDLSGLAQVGTVDRTSRRVTVGAGMRLRELNQLLAANGLAMPNL